ncbi:maleylpyruvate isomerase family mycothiol-dependent enzyme [Mycolicibacterium sp.]|uniref:maleylpyruvate isomerase family mycothiol-dependent enzyme n=1 Tax=Mycolicibacterium sp. TaxID=2320850 RepID=UPI003D0D240B
MEQTKMTAQSTVTARIGALRDTRAALLDFCRGLTDEQWQTPSKAAGWTVKDVIAHIGSGAHTMFTPASIPLLRTDDIERANDALVEARRDWSPRQVLAEYERWTARSTRLAAGLVRTPLARMSVPLGELGRFPLGLLMTAAGVFDQYTHLHFDLAPALGQDRPPADARQLDVAIQWMLAVLGNQLATARHGWFHRPIGLTLLGPGGGRWSVLPDGAITAPGADTAVEIIGHAADFPSWGTRRSPWREHDVTIRGDHTLGETFLGAMNIV